MTKSEKLLFHGTIASVKARIRLIRSFDQIPSHQYQGYTLILDGSIGEQTRSDIRIAVGPKAYETHQFRIGDQISGSAIAVADTETEWAEFYKVSGLKLENRAQVTEAAIAPGPNGGIAPPLEQYRAHGHFRLQRATCETKCNRCPFGLTMATQLILDHFDHSKVKWRFETHCYGPHDCPHYKAGPAYRVQGRKSWMVYVDDDVERAERGE